MTHVGESAKIPAAEPAKSVTTAAPAKAKAMKAAPAKAKEAMCKFKHNNSELVSVAL